MKVNEIFGGKNVVQGEGPFAGVPATFIRLWGCVPPYCEFCDTKYAWTNEKKESKEMNIKKIVEKVDKFGVGKLIVITGGEPFMQKDIYSLSKKLVKNGYIVQIETSGKAKIDMYAFDNIKTFVVMSPKQYKQNNGKFLIHRGNVERLKNRAGDFKFVVENEKELKMVLLFVNEFRIPNEKIWLMAKGETREKQLQLMPKLFKWCNKYRFRYSPRLHVLAFDKKRKV